MPEWLILLLHLFSDAIPHCVQILLWACDYVFMLGIKLIHVSKRVPSWVLLGFLWFKLTLSWCHMNVIYLMNSFDLFANFIQCCVTGTRENYSDVIWVLRHLKLQKTQLLVQQFGQVNIKENISYEGNQSITDGYPPVIQKVIWYHDDDVIMIIWHYCARGWYPPIPIYIYIYCMPSVVWIMILLACVYEGQLLDKLHLLYCGITRTSTLPSCMTHTHTWEQWTRCSESRSERTMSDESITECEIVMRERGQLAAGFYIAQCNVSCSAHVHICLTMYTWSNQKVTWWNTCPFATDHM